MRKYVRTAIIAVTAAVVLTVGVLLPRAVWNEDNAVHIDPSGIENSTLLVGTHLIHLSALTDTLYATAQKSANESGQSNIYYKSELANGVWFDITSASTLADITDGGVPVTNDTIAALFLTHHTKSDGITYDLRTNRPVSIFDIYSPYDLESMDELFPLKTQYDVIRELQADSDIGKMYIQKISAFFATGVRNGNTDSYDAQIGALQSYYNVLADNDGGAAEMEAVLSVMDALDSSRRAEVMNILDPALQALATDLQSVVDIPPDEEDEDDEGTKGSGSDPNLQSAVNDSLANVTNSYNTYSAGMLSEGVTTMSETRYGACMSLISHAQANSHSACDDDVADIIGLDNIQGGNVVDKAGELALLNDLLLPTATGKYAGGLSGGDNDEYRAAVAQNAAAALKNGIVKKARNELTIYRSELESFIDAANLRLGGDDAIAFIDGRLAQTQGYSMTVPRDDFAAIADESIEAHTDFLTRLRRSVELGMGGNATDELLAEKAALQTELLSALDNNDLAAAKDINGRISDIDDLIGDMPGGTGAAAAEAAQDIMSSITGTLDGGGDSDDLASDIDALGGLLPSNYAAIFPMLEDLHGRMTQKRDIDGDSSYDDAIAGIETLMLDNRDAYNRVTAAGLSTDEALAIADAYFNGGGDGARLFDDGLLGSGTGTGGAGTGTGGSGTGGTGTGTGGSGTGGTGTGGSGTGTGAGTGTDGAGTGADGASTGAGINSGTGTTGGSGTGTGGGTGAGTGGTGTGGSGTGTGGTGTDGAGTGGSGAGTGGSGAGTDGTGTGGAGAGTGGSGTGTGGAGTGTGGSGAGTGGAGTGTGGSGAGTGGTGTDGAGTGGSGTGTGGGTGGSGTGTDGSGTGTGGSGAGSGGTGGSGTGTGGTGAGGSGAGTGGADNSGLTGNGIPLAGTVTSIADNASDVLGGSANAAGLSGAEKDAVLALALSMYADELGDESLNGLMRSKANSLLEAGALAFEKVDDPSVGYVPARALADYLKLRYVWNRNLNGGALARGGDYRFFTVYSAEVITGPGKSDVDYMAFPAAYKNEMYLPDDYTYDAFGVWAENIPGTDIAILVSKNISDCAAELLSLLMQAAGI